MKKMKRFTMILAAVLLLAGAAFVPAKAATIGLDASPTDNAGFFVLKGASNNNSVQFTLTQAADVTINLLALGIPHVSMSLLQCATSACASTSVVATNGAPSLNGLVLLSTGEFNYAGLLAGTTYMLSLSGAPFLGMGLVLGSISAVATTPIPASLLMFLTGLGALGFFAKRRKLASAMGAAA